MNARLRKLAAHAVSAQRGRATLVDMLSKKRAFAYARRRLALPGVRALLHALLHAAEWFVLSQLFDPFYLTPILVARVVFAITANLGSGLVEPLRADLRELSDRGEVSDLRLRLDVAWTRASIGAALFACAGMTLVFSSIGASGGIATVVDLFVLAAVLRTASSWWTRTFEAGIQAFGRIPRHPAWFFAFDIIESLFPLVLWRWLGPWGVPLVVLATTMLSTTLALFYARRAYAMRGYERPRFVSLRTRAFWRGYRGLRALRALGVAAAQEFSGAIVGAALAGGVDGAVLLYFSRPVLALIQHVGRIYYADFAAFRRFGSWGARVVIRHVRQVVLVATAIILLALVTTSVLSQSTGLTSLAGVTLLSFTAGIASIEITHALIAASDRSLRVIAGTGVLLTAFLIAPISSAHTALAGGVLLTLLSGTLAFLRGRAQSRKALREGRLSALDYAAFVHESRDVDLWLLHPTTRERAAGARIAVVLSAHSDVRAVCTLDRTVFVATAKDVFSSERLAVTCGGLAHNVVRLERNDVRARLSYPANAPSADANQGARHERVPLAGDVGTFGALSSAIALTKKRAPLREIRTGDYDVFARWSHAGDLVDVVFVSRSAPADERNALRRAMWNESLANVLST